MVRSKSLDRIAGNMLRETKSGAFGHSNQLCHALAALPDPITQPGERCMQLLLTACATPAAVMLLVPSELRPRSSGLKRGRPSAYPPVQHEQGLPCAMRLNPAPEGEMGSCALLWLIPNPPLSCPPILPASCVQVEIFVQGRGVSGRPPVSSCSPGTFFKHYVLSMMIRSFYVRKVG